MTEDGSSSERPRDYADSASADAVTPEARSTIVLAALGASALVAAIAALVVVAIFDIGDGVQLGISVAAGVLGLLAAGVVARAVLLLRREQAALRIREADALRMAELDELTGLGNYRRFTRQLAAEVARSRRHDDPFSLVLLDLDGFKAINDELGHLAGDDALRLVADALRGALREEDVCCRQGGDEFAVIAVRAGEQEARDLAERLTSAIEDIQIGLGTRRLSAGAGWATFGRPARTADELILRADAALRASKRTETAPPLAAGAGATDPLAAQRHTPRGRPGHGETTRLALVSGLARALSRAHDERALAETTATFLAGAFDGLGAAALALDAAGRPRLLALASGAPEPPEAARMLLRHPVVGRALGGGAGRGARAGSDAAGTDASALVGGAAAARGADPAPRAAGHAHAHAHDAVVADELDAAWVDGAPLRCELAVPVWDGDERWGVLVVASDRLHAYGDAARTLARAIADQLGRALSARRLLDRLSTTRFGELYRVVGEGAGEAAWAGEPWRVADLAWRVGRALEIPERDLRALYLAALFHDVGTVGVPSSLLTLPAELHEEERALVREHPLIGERMLRALPLLREAAPIVRHEHERFDGGGYPDGLAGETIPLPARILLACDALVAMTSPRPWRPARTFEAAIAELRRVAGTQLDPRVVDALLDVVDGWDGDEDEDGDAAGARSSACR